MFPWSVVSLNVTVCFNILNFSSRPEQIFTLQKRPGHWKRPEVFLVSQCVYVFDRERLKFKVSTHPKPLLLSSHQHIVQTYKLPMKLLISQHSQHSLKWCHINSCPVESDFSLKKGDLWWSPGIRAPAEYPYKKCWRFKMTLSVCQSVTNKRGHTSSAGHMCGLVQEDKYLKIPIITKS